MENLTFKRKGEKQMNMRGVLTEEIQSKAKAFLNREISVKELRLYPYIDFLVKNDFRGYTSKLDWEEREILENLSEEGHLIYSEEKIVLARDFYDFIEDILAESYVGEFLE